MMSDRVPATATTNRTLLYVHGRQCKPAVDDYFDLVLAALGAGIERDQPEHLDAFHSLTKRIAYYGDLTTAFLTGAGDWFDEQLDLGDRRNALQQLRRIDRRKKFSLAAYDRLPGKTAVRELAADLAEPVLGPVGLSRRLIASLARDLDAYWNPKSDFGERLRSRVRDVLCDTLERGGEILLVTHGTGGIVAWDVLWQLSHDPEYARYADRKVDHWLSLGAPLGDRTVRRQLFGADERARQRFPCNVVSWSNVAAEDDWLCHDSTLADDYRAMLRQKQISAIRDYRIYNLAVRYGKSDPHCALGYLIHPRVSRLVTDWLARPQPGPEL